MPCHQYVHQARMNGRGSRQYADSVQVNVRRLVDWLELCCSRSRRPGLGRKANALLELMAHHRWRIAAGPHAGGWGDARGVDRRTHITVVVQGFPHAFHLRMGTRARLIDITGPGLR